jgi:hypothetical protein
MVEVPTTPESKVNVAGFAERAMLGAGGPTVTVIGLVLVLPTELAMMLVV